MEGQALARELPNTGFERAELDEVLFWAQDADVFERLQRALVGLPVDVTRRPAVEWFLDNFYIIVATSRQLLEDMPMEFFRKLPVVHRDGRPVPRVHVIAERFSSRTQRVPDREAFETFLAGFQSVTPLTIAELWAFPSLVRAVCLQKITRMLAPIASMQVPTTLPVVNAVPPSLSEVDEVVSAAVRTLISLKSIRWRDVFIQTSLVQQELRNDPAGIYDLVAFSTAEQCLHEVEVLACRARCSEIEVAREAVTLAQSCAEADLRRAHVGYYLIDEGRASLEAQLGIRLPLRLRLGRWVRAHATLVYLSIVGSLTVGLSVALFVLVRGATGDGIAAALASAIALVPVSTFAIAWVHWVITWFIKPRRLPRLNLDKGIPQHLRTAVVIPTLLADLKETHQLVEQLERHYLANPDENLQFALLADLVDADSPRLASDAEILSRAQEGIVILNERHGDGAVGPFHLLVRERQWNQSEGVYMGWERKRGKLEEFNRLLAGFGETSYTIHTGHPEELRDTRFVITLDSDTELPRGAARSLVAILGHALNRAEFRNGRVVAGYTVLQPRLDINPDASHRSRFASIFAGDTGLDIYSRAVSDVYQDFFGTGIYVGKGIYDVDAFRRSLEGKVPENALLSHDLFEGINGRAGLVSDIVLYEDYPPTYLAYARRMHRWIRGDWQLVPWLGIHVPGQGRNRILSPFTHIDRWKVLDNLRRSLQPLALFVLLVGGWFWIPNYVWVWTAIVLVLSAGHLLTNVASRLKSFLRGDLRATGNRLSDLRSDFFRWLVAWAFLPHEAFLITDAVFRTLVRVFVSRRGLLQWTSAAYVARTTSGRGRLDTWREMAAGPVGAVVLFVLVAKFSPLVLGASLPFLCCWLVSPELARWLARPHTDMEYLFQASEKKELRLLARRIWLFFETFVGSEDHWLPPDNVQLRPLKIAHRTSPTNIGLYLASAATAYDLGHTHRADFCARTRSALRTIAVLERYRGQLLNWYDTQNLAPLLPRYVSTVDNGNFVASLIALRETCSEHATGPVFDEAAWAGLRDTTELARRAVCTLAEAGGLSPKNEERILDELEVLTDKISVGHRTLNRWQSMIAEVQARVGSISRNLHRGIAGIEAVHAPIVREVSSWIEVLSRHAQALGEDLDVLGGWYFALVDAPEPVLANFTCRELFRELCEDVSRVALDELGATRKEVEGTLSRIVSIEATPEVVAYRERVLALMDKATVYSEQVLAELLDIAANVQAEIDRADFRFLYDEEAHQMFIGYDVSNARPDLHHYDLLASEARLASLVAIAFGHAPVEHWFHLGRPLLRILGRTTLVSWSGTMFEYLMPLLFTQSFPKTLLGRSMQAAVDCQIRYAEKRGVPWGISESGFAAVDGDGNYQYRAFGVPELAFQRGLAEDMVVAPYASLLALSIRPRAVLKNLQVFEQLGVAALYGPFEAIDFTPKRLLRGARSPSQGTVLHSYMAHHQGMTLVSLGNVLLGQRTIARFHRDPRIQTVVHLLQERVPSERPPPRPVDMSAQVEEGNQPRATLEAWTPRPTVLDPAVHLLSNSRLSVMSDAVGRGPLWLMVDEPKQANRNGMRAISIRPWEGEEMGGFCLFLRAKEKEQVRTILLSGGYEAEKAGERRVTYWPHKIETLTRVGTLAIRQTLMIACDDEVEIRSVSLKNEGESSVDACLTSYSDLAIHEAREHARHPVFSRLFIETRATDHGRLLIGKRRPQGPADVWPVAGQTLVADPDIEVSWDTSRATFIGRGQSLRAPSVMGHSEPLQATAGYVLEPCFSHRARLTLSPGEERRCTWLTGVSHDESELRRLLDRYADAPAARATDAHAERVLASVLAELGISVSETHTLQKLFSKLLSRSGAQRTSGETNRQHLWSCGISGDQPLLLVHRRSESMSFVKQVLRSCALWFRLGFRIDVVFVLYESVSYLNETRNEILRLAEALGLPELGGVINVVSAPRLSDSTLESLQGAAGAVLDTERGTFEEQVSTASDPMWVPRFLPAVSDRQFDTEPVQRPKHRWFDNGVGGFQKDGREYVVFLDAGQQTPAPWCNILANRSFGCLTSERGLGCTWAINSGENRLTPWRNDPVVDPPSEVIYIRDEESGVFWTPTPGPCGVPTAFEVTHGLGTTHWYHRSHGLSQKLQAIVHPTQPLKLLELRIDNLSSLPRRLTVTYYVPWVLGARRASDGPFTRSAFDADTQAIIAENAWSSISPDQVAFVVASDAVHGFTVDGIEFLGEGGVGDPDALHRWGLSNAQSAGANPCAALQVHIDLAAQGSHVLHFALGWGKDMADGTGLAQVAARPGIVDQTVSQLRAFWSDLLGAIHVETPEPAMDFMLNTWSLYQAISSRFFARSAFYQSSGAIGFRDQLQDAMALCVAAPADVRSHIVECAKHQFEEGDVLHWWHPPTGRGVRTRCSDDYLWLPFSVAHYVRTTGDLGVLDVQVPFLTGAELGERENERYELFAESPVSASLMEHCLRAVHRASARGDHGLPKMGSGDWNDGMNLVRGESVWLGWFLCAVMKDVAELCERTERKRESENLYTAIAGLQNALERAWDGAWYVRAFYEDGSALGSKSQTEASIDSISQSWSVLSGVGNKARASVAVESAMRKLVDDEVGLVRLLWPPFDKSPQNPGYIKGYPPGVRENGAQYTHAATWLLWALAELGRADDAERLFQMINPISRTQTSEEVARYRVEPYVLAADVYSVEPHRGRGGWTWYTGSAAWYYRTGIEAILGLRIEWPELRIVPRIPQHWPGYRATLRLRSAVYEVEVSNPDRDYDGVVEATVNGRVILLGSTSSMGEVRVRIGAAGLHQLRIVLGNSKRETVQVDEP